MCLVCTELLKHRMSIVEGERAATEVILTSQDLKEVEHAAKLKRAIRDMDLEALGELLDES